MGLRWCARGLLLIALAGVVSCDSELDLRYHGRQLVAEGEYRALAMFADGHDEFALALDRAHDDEMALLPFGGKPCRVGQVAAYYAVRGASDVRRDLRLVLFDSDDEPRGLRFVDTQCRQVGAAVQDVIDTRVVFSGFLLSIDGGRLLLVDPWAERTRVVSEQLTEIGSSADVLSSRTAPATPAVWLLEDDQLVLRDYDGNALRRAGDGVNDIAVARQSQAMIFSDRRGTYRLGHEGYAPQRIGDSGCKLRYESAVRGSQGFDLAMMLSPCAEGRLVALDPDGRQREFSSHVVDYFRRLFGDEDGKPEDFTFYVTQDDEGADKRYFMAPPDPYTDAIELDVPISSRSTLLPIGLRRGVARAWLITTDEEDARGGVFTEELGFVEAVRGVRSVAVSRAGLLVLHDYADGTGTLSMLSSTAALTTVAHDVPAQGLVDTGAFGIDDPVATLSSLRQVDLVLHDVDGDIGTLSRIEDDGRLTRLADDVPVWSPSSYFTSLRGGQLLDATRSAVVLSYLRDFDRDAGAGTLSVIDPNERSVVLDEHVTSHVSSGDSSRRGVLYSTAGPMPQVWFVQQ